MGKDPLRSASRRARLAVSSLFPVLFFEASLASSRAAFFAAALGAALLLHGETAFARDGGGGETGAAARPWAERLAETRTVVDRVVICFDEGSFSREIAAWDEKRFWPVLLWDSGLVPAFVEAFAPKEILLARFSAKPGLSLDEGLEAVAAAWGEGAGGGAGGTRAAGAGGGTHAAGAGGGGGSSSGSAGLRGFGGKAAEKFLLGILEKRGGPPLGAVLVAEGSPELAGGIALAAGRFFLPLVFETKEKHGKRVFFEREEEYRHGIAARLRALGIPYGKKFGDLDFLTVANDMPYGYVRSGPAVHGGGYTIDDAVGRRDGGGRYAWTGRLAGGPARSVYMAMAALFLQPAKGLFFSRYAPGGKGGFGAFDPEPALGTFEAFFPTEAVRHPGATLEKWRALEWPEGNRFGFVYVNSSGGAVNWSTSKGRGTFFDAPPTVPAVVHYTHSGSAARPFDEDTIAGRWLAEGAYIYFGSYAEPYLMAFVPPVALAQRVEAGMPLGAAMRHAYQEKAWVTMKGRPAKKGEEAPVVRFNVTAPWKLAYFGDPSYRLLKERPPRAAPGGTPGGSGAGGESRGASSAGRSRSGSWGTPHGSSGAAGRRYYADAGAFLRARPRSAGARQAHLLASIGLGLVKGLKKKPPGRRLVDEAGWVRIVRAKPGGELAQKIQLEMVRVWTAALLARGPGELYAKKKLAKLAAVPEGLRKITAAGAASPVAARVMDDFAKRYVAGIALAPESDVGKDPSLACPLLAAACSFEHSKGEGREFFSWVKEVLKGFGLSAEDLRKEVLKEKWITPGARKAVEAGLK